VNPGLPPLVGRIAALALLLALLALVWVVGLAPLLDDYRGDRETVAFASEQLPRLQQLAAEAPLLRAELERLSRDPSGSTRLLGGNSDDLAGADLQSRVSRDATRHGLALRSAQILPPVAEEGFRRIGIRVALEGSIAGLHRLLYSIETSPTFLFVNNLEIRSRSGGRVLQRQTQQRQAAERLAIRLDVIAYRREAAQ
jgi:hypothetical protein